MNGSLVVGRYMLLKKEGHGGTADIFRAFDQEKSRTVALKLFRQGSIADGVLSEIWNRESKALARLRHRNIVSFCDAGRCNTSGARFIVLEWFDGVTLAEELNKHSGMEYQEFHARYGEAVLSALTYAAEQDVIHRDISPGNILVAPSGEIKIIDFGQSKIQEVSVGLTVAGYATPPYCPPEIDSGVYTSTRDAFSFCAISIRAISGHELKNHDDLYAEFDRIGKLLPHYEVFKQALSRDPKVRPENIIFFNRLLKGGEEPSRPKNYRLRLRFSQNAHTKLFALDNDEQSGVEQLLRDINDSASVFSPSDDKVPTRFTIESRTFRLICDLDSNYKYMIVVIAVYPRRSSLASLWRESAWQPSLVFSETFPKTTNDRQEAEINVRNFYEDYDEYAASQQTKSGVTGGEIFEQWSKFLDMMADIERNRLPPLRYSKPTIDGTLLEVELKGGDQAEVGQVRTISNGGRQVFQGDVESVSPEASVLVSRYSHVREDEIPLTGTLDVDWGMARIAIKRQQLALEKFRDNGAHNPRIADYLTRNTCGALEATYASNIQYFNKSLDSEKKAIVSRFLAMDDLLLIHGPPGTGKTTLIVEMVRQFMKVYPACRILLVSQTHVAIDHALNGILKADSEIKVVRIGSGNRQLDEKIASCSMEQRGRSLRQEVRDKSFSFIEQEAEARNVRIDEIRMGLDSLELLRSRRASEEGKLEITNNKEEEDKINAILGSEEQLATIDIDGYRTKLRLIEERLRTMDEKQIQLDAELALASKNLEKQGKDGRDLAKLDNDELELWCDEYLGGDAKEHIRKLVETAENWQAQFVQSDDFRTVIIADSNIVSGTCVGFAKEGAAGKSCYDLCIVDESSKATSTELLVPMAQSKKIVLVGDHHQLPAVVDFALHNTEFQEEHSINKDVIEKQLFEALEADLNEGSKAELVTQFRMRKKIGDLISFCFYDEKLKTAEEVEAREGLNLDSFSGLDSELTWLDTGQYQSGSRGESRNGTSYYNEREAECVVAALRKIAFSYLHGNAQKMPSIGIVSGYSSQVRHIRRLIDADVNLSKLPIECSSVHQFQGREVDVCIYSIVRDNPQGDVGFLTDWRHLNVALSRARDCLVVVGSTRFCTSARNAPHLHELVQYFLQNHPDRIKEWSDA